MVSGDRHGFSALPSSVHLKVAPETVDLNLKVGVRSFVFAVGLRVILVSGTTSVAVPPSAAGSAAAG